jgi:hypothetical protein
MSMWSRDVGLGLSSQGNYTLRANEVRFSSRRSARHADVDPSRVTCPCQGLSQGQGFVGSVCLCLAKQGVMAPIIGKSGQVFSLGQDSALPQSLRLEEEYIRPIRCFGCLSRRPTELHEFSTTTALCIPLHFGLR